jgi:hypothetical protein
MQFVVNGGEDKVLTHGEATCNLGCDLRVFLDYGSKCSDDNSGKIEMILAAGQTAEPYDAFKQDQFANVTNKEGTPIDVDGKSYELAGSIDYASSAPGALDAAGDNNSSVYLDKLIASLTYKCGEKAELECQAGLAKNIQQDDCGRYQAGWYKCQSEYFGNGFEGFVNPFIWNKQTKGLQLTFKQGPLECYGHYGTQLGAAASVSDSTGVSNGFANSDTPGICDFGVCYNVNAPCPARVSLHCQQINNGSKGFKKMNSWVYANTKGASGSLTTNASAALAQAQEKNQYLNAITGRCESDFQGVDVNAYLTCANPKNTSDNNARLLKWSVGCVSKCRPIKCLPVGGLGAQAFGINLGTPTYLSGDLKTKQANTAGANADEKLKADDTPIICEASCLFNICGFNFPIFVDYLNNHEYKQGPTNNKSIYNVTTKTGSVLVCGMRPSRIGGLRCEKGEVECYEKHILDCKVEGGLDEDEE